MTKIAKLKKRTRITNHIISRIGETLYHDEGVRSIQIKISFKDGSVAGYRRVEDDDDFEEFFKEDED